MKANEIVLSICIPTYNRKKILLSRVEEIISYKNDDLEIIILDNCSDEKHDDISSIDRRIKVYRNNARLAATDNWIECLKYANGRYVLHLNDRDHIYGIKLYNLIEILTHNDFFAGYVSPSDVEEIKIYRGAKGKGSVPFGGYHPSGVLLNNSILKVINPDTLHHLNIHSSIDYMPHITIMYLLSCYNSLSWLEYKSSVIDYASADFLMSPSGVAFEKERKPINKNVWFHPEYIMMNFQNVFALIVNDTTITMKERKEILISAYNMLMKACTINYGEAVISDINIRRYNLQRIHFDFFMLEKSLKTSTVQFLNLCRQESIQIQLRKKIVFSYLRIIKFKINRASKIRKHNRMYKRGI